MKNSNRFNIMQHFQQQALYRGTSLRYLFELIPNVRQAHLTRNKNSVPLFIVKSDYFKNSFFPSTIIEWNNLDSNIRNFESLAFFTKRILAFIRPSANSSFHCHCPDGLKQG